MAGKAWTGGCQCGAVRFRVDGELGRAGVCYCRMCQKAFAAPFAALVSAPAAQVTWTRGAPRRFQSSNLVRRGFCADCGTPLTFEAEGDEIDLAVVAFDQPERIAPAIQFMPEGRLAWLDDLDALPVKQPNEALYGKVVSYQHPDHDTAHRPEPKS